MNNLLASSIISSIISLIIVFGIYDKEHTNSRIMALCKVSTVSFVVVFLGILYITSDNSGLHEIELGEPDF